MHMKKDQKNQEPEAVSKGVRLKEGELYLFHESNPRCPADSSLWGIYEAGEGPHLRLASCTEDMVHFRMDRLLPKDYCYRRRATRGELWDYACGLTAWDYESTGRRMIYL